MDGSAPAVAACLDGQAAIGQCRIYTVLYTAYTVKINSLKTIMTHIT